MFRQPVTTSFSDIWYRVAELRPRLSPHARITRQHFGASVAFVVEDPATGQYYRLSPVAYLFVGMLDGRRTAAEAWEACNAQLGDDAPTQRECVDLLARLQMFGLLIGENPIAADLVEQRQAQSRQVRRQMRTGGWMFFSIPLHDPSRWLEALDHVIKPLFSWWALAAWAVLAGWGMWSVVSNVTELSTQLNGLLAPGQLVWLSAVFLVLRIVHELGHAAACRALGGSCREIGLILILGVLPIPYCDATSSWRMPETWKRVVVSGGGVLFESVFASIAAIVWASRLDDPGLVRTLCYNVMFLSGVTTFLFNLNPLLRYDGYYILSDLLGIPNLAMRSRDVWRYAFERFVLGVRSTTIPTVRDGRELTILLVYGALSLPYRIFIFVSILLIVSYKFATIGITMALVAAAVWIVRPSFKALAYLLSSPKLIGRRVRAMGIVTAALAGVVVLAGFVPAPHSTASTGVLEPSAIEPVRAVEAGFVERVLLADGDAVVAGDPILVLSNPEVVNAVATARANVLLIRARLDQAMVDSPTERVVGRMRLEQAQTQLERALDRQEELTVRARSDGTLISTSRGAQRLEHLEGQFLPKGTLVGIVASTGDLIVRASFSDRQFRLLWDSSAEEVVGRSASFRVRGLAALRQEAIVERHTPAAVREAPNEALLAQAGGEIEIDPTDPRHHRTIRPQFEVFARPVSLPEGVRAGTRVRLRVQGTPRPVIHEVARRVWLFLSDRFEP